MKQFKGYAETQAITEKKTLPAGGYIIKILDATSETNNYGETLIISFDIAEGEYKGFYKENYQSQQMEDKKWKGTYRLNLPKDDGSEMDEWAKRKFKTAMNAIEDSNNGYHWDWNEAGLKNKTVGAIMFEKEYEYNGRNGMFTTCYALTATEKIKKGEFKIPEPKMLKRYATTPQQPAFQNIEDDGDLPF